MTVFSGNVKTDASIGEMSLSSDWRFYITEINLEFQVRTDWFFFIVVAVGGSSGG